MKHYGLEIPEGTNGVTNLTAPTGTSFPAMENSGELFFRTDQDKLYVRGSSSWLGLTEGTITDPLTLSDGSASAPTYSFTSSSDSGMYSDGSGNLRFSVDSTIALEIRDTEIEWAGSGILTKYDSSATDITGLVTGTQFGSLIIGHEDAHLVIGIKGNDQNDGFHVIKDSDNDDIYDEHILTAASNRIEFGKQTRAINGSASEPSYAFTNDTTMGMYRVGSNSIGFSIASDNVLIIESDGTLNVSGTSDYEDLITSDDDIPNKKYVDDRSLSDLSDVTFGSPITPGYALIYVGSPPHWEDGIPVFSNPNIIGNPSFQINQKGESGYSGIATSTLIHDEWKIAIHPSSSGIVDVSTSTVTPGQDIRGKAPITAIRIEVNTTDSDLGTNEYLFLQTGIIDTNLASYYDGKVTCSLRARANHTGTYTISARNPNLSATYLADFTINSSNVWEKKIITFTLDTNEGSGWADGTTRGIGLNFVICLGVGTALQGTNETWNSGSYLGTTNTDNFLNTGTNWIEFTALKLEGGDIATTYIDPDWIEEYEKAQFHYQQSYNYGTAPGTNTGLDTEGMEDFGTYNNPKIGKVKFPVKMRTVPTITVWDDNGAEGKITIYPGAVANITPAAIDSEHDTGFKIYHNNASHTRITFHWNAYSGLI